MVCCVAMPRGGASYEQRGGAYDHWFLLMELGHLHQWLVERRKLKTLLSYLSPWCSDVKHARS